MSRRKKISADNPPQNYTEIGKARNKPDREQSFIWSSVKNKLGLLAFLSLVVIIVACIIEGYFETRVNTPFSKTKLVEKSGLDVADRYWGSYRPGTYFGLSTREPYSPVVGLMWFVDSLIWMGQGGVRHWCEMADNLESFGWTEHDGKHFGKQDIQDGPFLLTTSFIKTLEGHRGGHWTARINVTAMTKEAKGEEVTLMFYAATEEKTPGSIATSPSLEGINGYTDQLGNFSISVTSVHGTITHKSYLSTRAPGLEKLKETVLNSVLVVKDKTTRKNRISLSERDPNLNQNPNFIVLQITGKTPFSVDVVYESKSALVSNTLFGEQYSKRLEELRRNFRESFFKRFLINESEYSEEEKQFAMAAASNLIGGVGYFYGASSVQSYHNTGPVPYWKAPLYTAVPSRSFFPRGFLWDEGFHSMLLLAWDKNIAFDIMCHWFDLMNVQGWIPREQILGPEALSKVPAEFVVQHNTVANPPTFFIALDTFLRSSGSDIEEKYIAVLERLYPRLVVWFDWFNNTQQGEIPSAYRWRGRDPNAVREINPKTLASGLDDYPRASHPTQDERHLDLRCWLALGARVLSRIAERLSFNGERFANTYAYLSDNTLLKTLHWSEEKGRFSDYGLHTDKVSLQRKPKKHGQPGSEEKIRVTTKEPRLRLVDSHFGYVSLFPFLLNLLDHDSPMLEKVLLDLKNPELLWTDYGLRSLATTSPLYMKRNTEHDPPYWRGQIWININVLAVQALRFYSQKGPHRKLASVLHEDLRRNIINNLFKQYKKTGYIWEQYNDVTGQGMGSRPFTGWSSLVVLLMSSLSNHPVAQPKLNFNSGRNS